MTKFTKLSLIAALAVAGTTASAQPLAEAIKNVEVSGTVVYRYNDYELAGTNNNYKVAVNVNSKVTDDVTFNSRFIMGDVSKENTTGEVSLNTSSAADGNLNVKLTEANFAYTGISNTAIIVGKQAIPTAFTVDRDSLGGENTGTGILALTTFGPATIHAAYFNQTNFKDVNDTPLSFTGAEDVIAAGVALAFGPVNVDASYVDVDDTFDAYTLGVDAAFDLGAANLEAFARYSALDLENSSADHNLWKVGVSASMGMFGAHLMYGATDEEGGTVGILAGTTTGFDEHWRVTLDNNADSSVLYAGIDAQVTDKINIALNYSDMDDDANKNSDESEVYGQITYDHAANLSTFVRFGQYDNDENSEKENMGRVNVQYTF